MSALIDGPADPVAYRPGEIRLEWVDLGAEVARIATDLQAGAPGRRVHFAIDAQCRPGGPPPRPHRPEKPGGERLEVTSGQDDALIEFGTAPAGDAAVCC